MWIRGSPVCKARLIRAQVICREIMTKYWSRRVTRGTRRAAESQLVVLWTWTSALTKWINSKKKRKGLTLWSSISNDSSIGCRSRKRRRLIVIIRLGVWFRIRLLIIKNFRKNRELIWMCTSKHRSLSETTNKIQKIKIKTSKTTLKHRKPIQRSQAIWTNLCPIWISWMEIVLGRMNHEFMNPKCKNSLKSIHNS